MKDECKQNNQLNIKNLVDILRSVLADSKGSVPLHEPYFAGQEWEYVKECLDTGWVSSVGKYVDLFEEKLAEYTGVAKAVAVTNGTAALHIALVAAGVEKGDEVLVPALTFVATTNAVAYCGAIPHFVDSDFVTLGTHAEKLRLYLRANTCLRNQACYNRQTGRRIRAVIPMHTFGHPVSLDELVDVCKEFNLILVEDAAEALGSFYKGKHMGNWGLVSAVSFNGNKIITTGGGGAVLTNDREMARKIKHLTTQAKIAHRWAFYHDQIGYNYRLPNINAALGCAQIEQLPDFLASKRLLAERYQAALAGVGGVEFFREPDFAQSNYWLNAILLDEAEAAERDAVLVATNDAGIMTRPVWDLMYTLPMYQECPRMDCSIAESVARRLINLPSSVNLCSR